MNKIFKLLLAIQVFFIGIIAAVNINAIGEANGNISVAAGDLTITNHHLSTATNQPIPTPTSNGNYQFNLDNVKIDNPVNGAEIMIDIESSNPNASIYFNNFSDTPIYDNSNNLLATLSYAGSKLKITLANNVASFGTINLTGLYAPLVFTSKFCDEETVNFTTKIDGNSFTTFPVTFAKREIIPVKFGQGGGQTVANVSSYYPAVINLMRPFDNDGGLKTFKYTGKINTAEHVFTSVTVEKAIFDGTTCSFPTGGNVDVTSDFNIEMSAGEVVVTPKNGVVLDGDVYYVYPRTKVIDKSIIEFDLVGTLDAELGDGSTYNRTITGTAIHSSAGGSGSGTCLPLPNVGELNLEQIEVPTDTYTKGDTIPLAFKLNNIASNSAINGPVSTFVVNTTNFKYNNDIQVYVNGTNVTKTVDYSNSAIQVSNYLSNLKSSDEVEFRFSLTVLEDDFENRVPAGTTQLISENVNSFGFNCVDSNYISAASNYDINLINPASLDTTITKSVDKTKVKENEELNYTLEITNNGNIPKSLSISDTINNNLSIKNVTTNDNLAVININKQNVKVDFANVPPNGKKYIYIKTLVNRGTAINTTIPNSAIVSSGSDSLKSNTVSSLVIGNKKDSKDNNDKDNSIPKTGMDMNAKFLVTLFLIIVGSVVLIKDFNRKDN